MNKRILCILMVLAMAVSLLPITAAAAYEYKARESDYFYNQLNDRSKAIYKKLLTEFTGPDKEAYYEGTKSIDLTELPEITNQDIQSYLNGNKDIFNDFAAAKDALDLDHSELWYIDSGYLTFRVTHSSMEDDPQLTEGYHILVGPGRGPTYFLGGNTVTADEVKAKEEAVNNAIDDIIEAAKKTVEDAQVNGAYSEPDLKAALVTAVHDLVVKNIHYRYEIECRDKDNAKYIRTLYGIVTHEGVCEAYARTLQVALTRLGVECVLIHGVQTKGTPEDHMWNAVNIPDTDGDHWYVVDATWDDPLVANWDGSRDLSFHEGLDGRETNTYLMVGQSIVGEHWRPSGYVSTGSFEFKYPTIETGGYSGATAFGDSTGLEVKYSAGGSTEDGIPAGVFSVTYQGMNAAEAGEKGLYFMVKMYDYHPDGTADVMQDWYYADAMFFLAPGNPYFGDWPEGLRFATSTCEYVEVAVTSREPDHRSEWTFDPSTSYLSMNYEAGFFHGDESDIIAQSGLLYNVNSKYEAPPYVLTQEPKPNGTHTAGYEYDVEVTWDDDLYHILPSDESAADGIATVDIFNDNYEQARSQQVRVRYVTLQQDLHSGGVMVHQVVGNLPFDLDRDGYVDMPGDDCYDGYTQFKWIYKYDGDYSECPNSDNHVNGECSVENGCPINGVAFKFNSSDQWIDDATEYNFTVEGVVGSRSSKFPNNFAITVIVPGLCPACYRSQGIDWNLWGQPTLLDAPDNLDLYGMAQSGGTDPKTLAQLNEQMNTSDLNGRLMLVVENKSKGAGSREDYEEIDGALDESGEIPNGEVIGSSVFEINFNRICPMVKLKPNRGESLRVQVGYPAGITYEDLGSGEVELKAFHFTRCDPVNEEEHPCEHLQKELDGVKSEYEREEIIKNHAWGEHIVGVNEITIVPTPYGMVIMCDAFSPFEIVAVRKDGSTPTAIAEAVKSTTLVVVSDTNGVVLVDGREAVGVDGNVSFTDTDTKTFTVKPNEGYVVDTVSLGGREITVDQNCSFTVNGSELEHSDVLSVTFIPETVKEAQEAEGLGSTVVAKVCTHSTLIDDPNDTTEAKNATCTEAGYAKAQICKDCGQTVVPGTVIPATGHTVDKTNSTFYKQGAPATCTEAGTRDFVMCSTCGEILSNSENIPAIGHVFTKYTDGNTDCRGTEKIATCDRDGCDVTETLIDPSGALEHVFTSYEVTSEATCTADAIETAQCDYGCGTTDSRTVSGTKTDHSPDATGHCTVCKEYLCKDGHSEIVTTEAVEATCTEAGHTAGEKCAVCNTWITPEEITPALGHDWDGTHVGDQCKRCGIERQSDEHTPVDIPDVEPTCDSQGQTGGTKCEVCGDIIEQPTIVPALGHDWDEETAEWFWSPEGELSASVTLYCSRDNAHSETFIATLDDGEVTTEATCLEEGVVTYTATAVISDTVTLTDTKTVTTPKTDHKWGEEPAETTEPTCTHHGTEVYECSVCQEKKVVTLEDELLPHEYAVDFTKSTPGGCTTEGTIVSSCIMCGDEKSEVSPALGHDWNKDTAKWTWFTEGELSASVTLLCSRDFDHSNTYKATLDDGVVVTEATCLNEGVITYTATAVISDTVTLTDTNTVTVPRTDHSWSEEPVETTSPTCTEHGTAVYECSVCHERKVEALDDELLPHNYVIDPAKSTPAGCTTDGTNVSYCSMCNEEKIETVPALGHNFDENGVCTRCGESQSTVDPDEPVLPNEPADPVDPDEPTDPEKPVTFPDVADGIWYEEAVSEVAARGLILGDENGNFNPDMYTSRGQLMTILARLSGVDTTGSEPWYKIGMDWAVENGISDGTKPTEDLPREQFITMLYRYMGSPEVTGDLSAYPDADKVSAWAYDAMVWAVRNGLVEGTDEGLLQPDTVASRAVAAKILARFLDTFKL